MSKTKGMDLKERFKSLLENQKASKKPSNNAYLSLTDHLSPADFEGHLALVAYQARKNSLHDDPPLSIEAQDVLIDTIEPIYFDPNNPEVGCHELEKFPDINDIHVINGIRSRLRKQLTIVSRRVSDLIINKQAECMEEMEKISKLQKEACLTVGLCVESRNHLHEANSRFISPSLQIISNHLKKQKILSVINNLKTIRTLQMTDLQLQRLLKSEDYPGAIQLLLECQTAASTFKHFTCISQLSSKLQNTLKMAQEQLDAALSNVVINFNSNTYFKLQVAYSLIDQKQTLMDQLHLHFTSHIHNSAFTVVLGYVELYNSFASVNNSSSNLLNNNADPNASTQSAYNKMKYSDVCKYVNNECFLPCYLDLCKTLWRLLRNYNAVIKWHKEGKTSDVNLISNMNDSTSQIKELSLTDDSYIQQKLQHGLLRVWQDVQAKVRTFILASNLSHFKFDDFLKVLDITNRIIAVGENFCGCKCEGLKDAIKLQSINFFQQEHLAKLEELHMFLENEAWHAVPLKHTFTVYQLLEYRFVRTTDSSDRRYSTTTNLPGFESFDDTKTPFDIFTEEDDSSMEEDILAAGANSDDDTDDDDHLLNYVDEEEDEANNVVKKHHNKRHHGLSRMPVVTNTSLAILRLVGKYILMMKLLQPIASEVFACLTQLVHYYLYTICHTFGLRKYDNKTSGGLSKKLTNLLNRIEREIIIMDGSDTASNAKVHRVQSSGSVMDEIPSSRHGIACRVNACESLLLLLRELTAMKGHSTVGPLLIRSSSDTPEGGGSAVPDQKVLHFYTTLDEVLPEVIEGIYSCVASSAIPQDLLQQMMGVSWAISNLESIHNAYVDEAVVYVQNFKEVLSEVSSTCPLPSSAERGLYEALVKGLHHTLLQGYAAAKTCSNEGRSLMQLDYQQLTSKLEPLTGLRPLPGRDLVEGFIKAFYLPESALREWLVQQKSLYTPRQLSSLLVVMTHIPKQTRTTLLESIAE